MRTDDNEPTIPFRCTDCGKTFYVRETDASDAVFCPFCDGPVDAVEDGE